MCACPRHLNRSKTAQNFNPMLALLCARRSEERPATGFLCLLWEFCCLGMGALVILASLVDAKKIVPVCSVSRAHSFPRKRRAWAWACLPIISCLVASLLLLSSFTSLVAPAVGHRQLYDGHHCRLLLCLSAWTICSCHSALGLAFVCPSLPVRLSLSLPGAERASLVWPLVRYFLVRSALNALKAGKATNAHRVVQVRPIYTNAHPSRSLHSPPQQARRSPKSARPRARSLSHCLSKRPTR